MRVLALALPLALAACTSRDARPPTSASVGAPVDIAVQRGVHGHVLLPVRVRNRDTFFLLDSGASADGLSPRFAAMLGLSGEEKAQAVGAGGDAGSAPIVTLPALTVGPAIIPAHRATVEDFAPDEPGVGGLFGRNFLLLHDTEIDLAHGRLRLFPAGSSRTRAELATPSFSRVPFTQAMGLPRVTVRIDGGQPVPAIVDLGATASIVSAQAASSAGPSQPAVGGGGAAVGADGRATAVTPRMFGSVRIGDVEIQRPTLLVGDLPVFEALGLGKGPAMLLGLDLLDRRTIVLDYKSGEIVFSHAAG